jgi:hypothetical protein
MEDKITKNAIEKFAIELLEKKATNTSMLLPLPQTASEVTTCRTAKASTFPATCCRELQICS